MDRPSEPPRAGIARPLQLRQGVLDQLAVHQGAFGRKQDHGIEGPDIDTLGEPMTGNEAFEIAAGESP